MKIGKICRSLEKPSEGFSFGREGYKIYISFIEPNSIHKLDSNNEYEYRMYDYYGAINSYEDLVNKTINLKYTIESELSLAAKAIIDSNNAEYVEYRKYVDFCKSECKSVYESLGLNKEEI